MTRQHHSDTKDLYRRKGQRAKRLFSSIWIRRYWRWVLTGVLAALISIIPLRTAIALHQAPQPEAIFVLGGHPDREIAAAQVARYYPHLDIWVSTGSEPSEVLDTFRAAQVPSDRLHLDYQASDTVTNFATLVAEFEARGLQHLWLITSDFHMARAEAIATIILGSHGIVYTPYAIPSNKPTESIWRILRDVFRSLMWVITGQSGATAADAVGL